ncbi:uncharacterized protein BJ171DRAFT_625406 [Polychytrium aggregatum]|uniref:uncharacterized protein n=1 Tax=Polychytrium aggregatum TaxID=110093 RepID=UPI0022FE62A0|nr:uncharacterized protein BJ171DRAFT_625406 [Polychytrium aggregatum]KAI9203022.1 hypothetical protein BJ171DRAFT_625406 [Polychytrium aggregatum]
MWKRASGASTVDMLGLTFTSCIRPPALGRQDLQMPLSYDKWNHIEDYYSSDEDTKRPPPAAESPAQLCTLYTVPWDSHCELVRWALDRHEVPYLEKSIPWGLHLWSALAFSDPIPAPQQVHFPILVNPKGEVQSTTQILTFLFSSSFTRSLRIYTPVSVLDIQESYDDAFAAATRTLYLNMILSSDLAHQHMVANVHLNTHKAIYSLTWPFWKRIMRFYYHINPNTVKQASETVDLVFARVGKTLRANGSARGSSTTSPYQVGEHFTAADLSFAAHAALVLLPSEDDGSFGYNMGVALPSLKEVPLSYSLYAKRLRATTAGKYAIQMYRKERGFRFGRKESRFSRENNPWWAEPGKLGSSIISALWVVVLIVAPLLVLVALVVPIWVSLTVMVAIAGTVWLFWGQKILQLRCVHRLRQLCFILFAKHGINLPKRQAKRQLDPEAEDDDCQHDGAEVTDDLAFPPIPSDKATTSPLCEAQIDSKLDCVMQSDAASIGEDLSLAAVPSEEDDLAVPSSPGGAGFEDHYASFRRERLPYFRQHKRLQEIINDTSHIMFDHPAVEFNSVCRRIKTGVPPDAMVGGAVEYSGTRLRRSFRSDETIAVAAEGEAI